MWGTDLRTQIDGHTLQFEPEAAKTGMNKSADMIQAMLAYKNAVGALGLDKLPAIGSELAGKNLAEGLSRRGTELQTIFDQHIDILTGMMDTFQAAGEAYRYADGVSKEQLDKVAGTIKGLGDIKVPTTASNEGLGPKQGYRLGMLDQHPDDDFPGSLKDWKEKHGKDGKFHDDVYCPWRNGQEMQWEDLIRLGNSINPDPYVWGSEDYKTLADKIKTRVSTFVGEIESLGNSWRGAGSQAAREAVRNYAKDIQPLLDQMGTMSQLLDYTSKWMAWTRSTMPKKKEDKACTDDLGNYRRYYERDYMHPGQNTQACIPIMPAPKMDAPKPPEKPKDKPEDKPKDKPEDKPKDHPHNNGGGGNNNNGGGANQQHPNQQKHDKTDPNKKHPNQQHPNQQNPNQQHPNQQHPNQQNPNGTNPNGTNPNGTNPNGSNPNQGNPNTGQRQGSSGGSDMSQLTSALSTLMSGASTLAQQLPTLLQQLQSLQSTDLSALATALGVPEDKLTTAFTAIEKDPTKLAQLGQLLGVTAGTDVPQPVDPVVQARSETVPVDGAVRAGQAPGTPGFTNLFRTGLGAEIAPPPGTPLGAPEGAMVATASSGAEPVAAPVDFVRTLEHGIEQALGVPEATVPVTEATMPRVEGTATRAGAAGSVAEQ
ncbi:hypothetical protein JMUB6875_54370 [Nocardia sp. JMUB6875]